jgi:hypothetical protein
MVDDPRLRRYLIRAERGVLARQLEHRDRVALAILRYSVFHQLRLGCTEKNFPKGRTFILHVINYPTIFYMPF